MKIKNNFVLAFCILGFMLGILDSLMAYDEEIQIVLEYKSNYSNFRNNWTLFYYLVFRYLKYILIIYSFSVGFLNKFAIIIVVMIKSYFYSFTFILVCTALSGFTLFKNILMSFTQMTASFIITLIFAQVIMNCIEGRYYDDKKNVIQFLAFVFSLICCIIISLVDLLIIKLWL